MVRYQYNRIFIYFICFVSALGGLLFGYDWVVIGGAVKFYEKFFGIEGNAILQGIATSSAVFGCMFGAMTAGALADKYGRKPLLILSAVFFTVSAIATGIFNDFTLFCIARFIGGIGIGIASALSPMYIAEVSPAEIRGKLVSLNQMTIVLGILLSQIVNLLIAKNDIDGTINPWNIEMGWRWMFWAETIPALLFLIMSFFLPESPRWTALNGLQTSARHLLEKIGGNEYGNIELNSILISEQENRNTNLVGFKALFSKPYLPVMILGIVIAVFQQWCGTNVIFIYAQEVFSGAGYSVSAAFINIVITGIVNVLFTFVALYTIDRWGRRSLMLLGAIGLAITYLILGTCFYMEVKGFIMVALSVTSIAIYAMTLGPVTWVLLSEIFPNRIRGLAMSIATFALWVGCGTLTFSFPSMNASLGCSGSFGVYSLICFIGFVYLFKKCPETKGVSLEELEKELLNK